jgi:hypothetical protein
MRGIEDTRAGLQNLRLSELRHIKVSVDSLNKQMGSR